MPPVLALGSKVTDLTTDEVGTVELSSWPPMLLVWVQYPGHKTVTRYAGTAIHRLYPC